jgi:hypothetical protein
LFVARADIYFEHSPGLAGDGNGGGLYEQPKCILMKEPHLETMRVHFDHLLLAVDLSLIPESCLNHRQLTTGQ